MIYVLTEQLMNGTVTMNIMNTGIEAESFKEAINKIKKLDGFASAKIQEETNDKFTYYLHGGFPVYGSLDNQPLKII